MPRPKLNLGKGRISLLRTAAVLGGMLFIIHFVPRECSRMADRPFKSLRSTFAAVTKDGSPDLRSSEKFSATAYCISGTTVTGHQTRPGIVSADPEVIPLGSVIYVDSPLKGGIYQVLDTGELIKGKIIDIFIPSYEHCIEFGRRMVKVTILRYGFDGKTQKPPEHKAD